MKATAQPPLLVLPGALGVADGGAAVLGLLGRGRTIVAFNYGEERRLEDLLGRALKLVERQERFDVLGLSVGGWLGQCLAAREPGRVRKLVLAHSFALEAGDAWRFAAAASIWPLLPRALLRAAVLGKARRALAALAGQDRDAAAAALESVHQSLRDAATVRRLEAQQYVLRDSLRYGSCSAACPVLIVEGGDDPILSLAVRERLARRYPDAERVVLEAVGHAAALAAPVAVATAIDRFLRR